MRTKRRQSFKTSLSIRTFPTSSSGLSSNSLTPIGRNIFPSCQPPLSATPENCQQTIQNNLAASATLTPLPSPANSGGSSTQSTQRKKETAIALTLSSQPNHSIQPSALTGTLESTIGLQLRDKMLVIILLIPKLHQQ